ncbi:MAG TPA: Rieske (2Fe-2S) protein [Bacteroidia bacterium]|jgi:cytochrome b6-f complex iron-sulfur subunit|nr:Rieske (2Fe-2S) protein [Bacteroidia bacterium]
MERRTFIKNTCILAGMSWFLQACSTHKYITDFTLASNRITVHKSSFTVIKKEKEIQQKFILLKPDNFQFPIVLYKLSENEYKALLLQCTHQGCELNAYETTLVCPCHGAEFNKKGEVTQGPADTNLKSFTTTQDNENIYIQF